MMALTFLVLFGMMLARCCCGGAGRRRRSRKHSADPYATSVPTTTTTTTAAAIDPVTGRPYRTNRSWNPFANRRSRRTPSQQPMTYPNNHSELRV
ncbi:hypothetical protein DFS34DRAFT_599929 [Phlyctochytrium arcticum]|nr:hypothetical protein DFS34DRAFT_599929 [Phlyctochytrium arcticum]